MDYSIKLAQQQTNLRMVEMTVRSVAQNAMLTLVESGTSKLGVVPERIGKLRTFNLVKKNLEKSIFLSMLQLLLCHNVLRN